MHAAYHLRCPHRHKRDGHQLGRRRGQLRQPNRLRPGDGNNAAVNCSPPSGGTFPLGTPQVDCSAADAAGNKAEESFKVNVTYDVASPCNIGEIEPPVNNLSSATDQGISAYKYGSRGLIPAKFKAFCNGDPIDTQAEADAHPMKLTLTKLGSTRPLGRREPAPRLQRRLRGL